MNKNTTYLVLILLALVLFSGYADGITGLASLRCVDKDRLDTSRKTCIKLAGKGTWCDRCADAKTVSEVRCISGNRRDRKNIACAEGYECQDGACVVKQVTCTDTDGGKDYYVKGALNYGHEDYCMDSTTLKEYFCDSPSVDGYNTEFYVCPNGCQDGACTKSTKNEFIPHNFYCFLNEFKDNSECSQFYDTQIQSNLVCPKYYNPVCGKNGKFYPSACWAEQLGTSVASYGYCPELISVFRSLWRIEGFDVPSPNIEFSYSGSGLMGGKGGVWLRSFLWENPSKHSVLDYNIKAYRGGDTYYTSSEKFDYIAEYSDVGGLLPTIGINPKSLLVFVMFDDAYPEQVLLDWTPIYENLMNDYIRKKQQVSNPIQYNIIPVVINPPENVEKTSPTHIYFSNEEIQKIYDSAIQKIGSQNFQILIISPVIGFGGYHSVWNNMELIKAPLHARAPYSTADKIQGINSLFAFHDMFSTISHEVLHGLGLPVDHVPMGYGTYFLDGLENIDFTTGKILHGEAIDRCEFFANSPDYYAVELPTEFKIKVGEEPTELIKINSNSGNCLVGFQQNEYLKDYDKDGEYELMYKNNLIGIELQRALGWVDIDGDNITELIDPNPYGGWKKL